MPDHLHWLFRLDSGTLSGTIQRMKLRSAQAINRIEKRHGPVWQAGFHDHCIRDERSLQGHARYLIENPLRAGLADKVGDYPHLWCAWTCDPSGV
jgi:REP element-mobilizing transposase RayT